MVQRLSLVFGSALYVTGFFVTLVWLVPSALGIHISHGLSAPSLLRALGAVPLLVGAAIAFWCFANFVVRGKGTPAPFDAPRHLVISGPYRYMRNPMYVGCFLFLVGLAAMFAEFSTMLLGYGTALLLAVNLFIFFYEEPTLRRKFNGEYEEYCRNVGRWIPRTSGWRPREKAEGQSAG